MKSYRTQELPSNHLAKCGSVLRLHGCPSVKPLVRAMSAQANHLHNAGERQYSRDKMHLSSPSSQCHSRGYSREVCSHGLYQSQAQPRYDSFLNHAQVLEQPPAAYKEVTSPHDSKCLPIATQSSPPTWGATAVRIRIPIYGSVCDVASH